MKNVFLEEICNGNYFRQVLIDMPENPCIIQTRAEPEKSALPLSVFCVYTKLETVSIWFKKSFVQNHILASLKSNKTSEPFLKKLFFVPQAVVADQNDIFLPHY